MPGRCVPTESVLTAIARRKRPTLALAGGASPAWARAAAEAIAAAVPNSQARVLEGQGHRVADEVLIPVLTGFFA
jgi:pimeloyl-ACP methyl ester carboxylesterase